jgi:quercetin dioxygenase-like cupin family protein
VQISRHPFSTIAWDQVAATSHPGETGTARWQTHHLGDVRIRRVHYSPGYVADHWCTKGHVLLCLEGSLRTDLADGRTTTLAPGDCYTVGDDSEPHRSSTVTGATLFIVD